MNRLNGPICGVLLFACVAVVPAFAQAPTTVILVRHAEKGGDPSERDPELSEAGKVRAQTLAHVLGELGVTRIYSTPYLRTQHTAQPLADVLGIEVTTTPISRSYVDDLAAMLKTDHAGEVVVVVSHSNTVPPLVNALGAGPFDNLAEEEYDDLFVVTIGVDGQATALRLRYGIPTP